MEDKISIQQLDCMEEHIGKAVEASVKKYVNGNIADLRKEIMPTITRLDQYIKDDYAWKNEILPIVKMGENIQGFGKVTLYLIGFASAIGGLFLFIEKFFIKK